MNCLDLMNCLLSESLSFPIVRLHTLWGRGMHALPTLLATTKAVLVPIRKYQLRSSRVWKTFTPLIPGPTPLGKITTSEFIPPLSPRPSRAKPLSPPLLTTSTTTSHIPIQKNSLQKPKVCTYWAVRAHLARLSRADSFVRGPWGLEIVCVLLARWWGRQGRQQ